MLVEVERKCEAVDGCGIDGAVVEATKEVERRCEWET